MNSIWCPARPTPKPAPRPGLLPLARPPPLRAGCRARAPCSNAWQATLDAKTTPEAIAKFKELYVKCVVRDTPDAANLDLAKSDITYD